MEMNGLKKHAGRYASKTAFGANPPTRWCLGKLEGKTRAFLAAHGPRDTRILPREINYARTSMAMKVAARRMRIIVSAVGSLKRKKKDLQPGAFLVPDQFLPGTKTTAPDNLLGEWNPYANRAGVRRTQTRAR